MNQKFVVSHLDQQMGPFDEQELKMKWAAGEILPIDYVYDEAKEDWILLADRFAWAAKPVKDDGSAPPPIREVNILKRAPPTARPAAEMTKVAPSPVLNGSVPVSETLKQALDVIRYTEIAPRKPEPKKTENVEITKVTVTPTPAEVTATAAPAPEPKVLPAPPPEPLRVQIPFDSYTPAPRPVPSGVPKVTLVNGVAEIDFTPAKPGDIELAALDTSGAVRSTEPLRVHVKAAEPVQVVWEYPSTQTVGQDVQVKIRALDERGHLCEHYDDQYLIQIRGPVSQDVNVQLRAGHAVVLLNHTKTERWDLALNYSGPKKVQLPEPAELEWQPGPAVRLVLDGPHEYLAGDPMKVKVKAVDAYGNTAKTFQGTVALEVKAS